MVYEELVNAAKAKTDALVCVLDAEGLDLADLRDLRVWPENLPRPHREWVVSMAHLIQALGAEEGVDANTAPRPVQERLAREAYRLIGFLPALAGRAR
jgi:hypothetical protein